MSKIRQAENARKTAESLAVNLLLAMFSEEELKKGNCTTPRREDITLLDQNRVSAIRGTVYMHENYAHVKQIFLYRARQFQIPCVAGIGGRTVEPYSKKEPESKVPVYAADSLNLQMCI